jgi:hypothetical protein
MDKKEDCRQLTPVYGLAILDGTFDKQTAEFYHHYKVVNLRNTSEAIKGKEVEDSISAVSADLQGNDDVRRALDMCEAGAFTEAELKAYDEYWDIVRVERTLIVDSRAKGVADVVRNCKRRGFSLEQLQEITG